MQKWWSRGAWVKGARIGVAVGIESYGCGIEWVWLLRCGKRSAWLGLRLGLKMSGAFEEPSAGFFEGGISAARGRCCRLRPESGMLGADLG